VRISKRSSPVSRNADPGRPLERINRSFIHQQDGNVVPDGINPPACGALEAVSCVLEEERFLTNRAD
jgi:hypothetical protein